MLRGPVSALVLDIVDPAAESFARPGVFWVVSGAVAPLDPAWPDSARADGRAEAALVTALGDATVIRVELDGERPVALRIWKGLSSGHEVYVLQRADGALVLADHFRNAVAHLPAGRRDPSPAALIDHYLLRFVPGRLSYAAAITRPAHGTCLDIELASGRSREVPFDRIVSGQEMRTTSAWVGEIDRALSGVLAPVAAGDGVVNMLSGGIDSSLIQTYFGDRVPALTVASADGGARLGGTRAEMVAKLLGVPLRQVAVSGADFLRQLEAAIDGRGMPPQYPQWVTLADVFRGPDAAYVIGERADALFSREGGRVPLVARYFTSRLTAPAVGLFDLGARVLKKRGFQLLPQQARAMRNDPLSPEGWPSQILINTDLPLAEDVFGPASVRERIAARLAYMAERAVLLGPQASPYLRNLEAAQWLVYYDEQILLFRHLAFALGKRLHAPFSSRALLSAAAAVPPAARYSRNLEAKYLLNDLLAMRLPGYDTRLRKDHIEMPMQAYYESGPLKDVWQRYPVPDPFAGTHRFRLTARMTEATWNAITHAIWKRRIADNPDLAPLPRRVWQEWRAGGG